MQSSFGGPQLRCVARPLRIELASGLSNVTSRAIAGRTYSATIGTEMAG